ncbi:MAG TPA: DUF4290 domain-containing protein [Flavobacteriaceae bacterium]|nr:DUF4290 domain-containing protein [Flavobacteriaceae bacterium]
MINNLEYNSERNKLIIPEYGRHIQKMVEITTEVEDDEKRNEMAHAIIKVMGNLSPHLRDVPEFQEQLWDQLFMMSDYKLEVDSPFPKPTAAEKAVKPDPLPYPENNPKYRFYGNNIKKMIDAVSKWEDGPKKEGLILTIANHMKKSYLNWNKDVVEDNVIFKHLYDLSDGRIDLNPKDEDLRKASNLVKGRKGGHHKRRRPKRHSRGRKRN